MSAPIESRPRTGASRESGQLLVVFALFLVAIVAGLGLILDAGQGWAEQRRAQNTADAMAYAGALELAKRLAGVTPVMTDADVCRAITYARNANIGGPTSGTVTCDATTSAAFYVDGVGTTNLGAVGAGTIPNGAAGVRAGASRQVHPFVTGQLLPVSFTASADATAIAGYVDNAGAGSLLPIAVPVNFTFCDGNNDPVSLTPAVPWPIGVETVVPLCDADPTDKATGGNVGWLDWDPPHGGIGDVADSISNPDNPGFRVPSWMEVAEAGNSNSHQLEDALIALIGQTVLVPRFDAVCGVAPTGEQKYLSDCPEGELGKGKGGQWYHLHSLAAFTISGVHTQGNNSAVCGGNGKTGCLTGQFNGYVYTGTVDPGPGYNAGNPPVPGAVVGVQMIR